MNANQARSIVSQDVITTTLDECYLHIGETAGAGYTSCQYEIDSEVNEVVIKAVVGHLRYEDGYRVKRDNRILHIDWGR